MVTIKFDKPAAARLTFEPGDEVRVKSLTPELQALVREPRLDGCTVAHIVKPAEAKATEPATEEITEVPPVGEETAVTQGRSPSARRTAVSK
jgi:hypothetical protein